MMRDNVKNSEVYQCLPPLKKVKVRITGNVSWIIEEAIERDLEIEMWRNDIGQSGGMTIRIVDLDIDIDLEADINGFTETYTIMDSEGFVKSFKRIEEFQEEYIRQLEEECS